MNEHAVDLDELHAVLLAGEKRGHREVDVEGLEVHRVLLGEVRRIRELHVAYVERARVGVEPELAKVEVRARYAWNDGICDALHDRPDP